LQNIDKTFRIVPALDARVRRQVVNSVKLHLKVLNASRDAISISDEKVDLFKQCNNEEEKTDDLE